MTFDREFRVIGVYEDFRLDVFPTHVAPIVAEWSAQGYRRWSYRIERPYRLRCVAPMGEFHLSPEKLFPVVTFHLCAPQRLQEKSQVIALSKQHVLVEHRRRVIIARLLLAVAPKLASGGFVWRTFRTILNAL